MSFGSESGRTRSGSKGFSGGQKKLKKKKQDFHTHRLHSQDAGSHDPEEVRSRTILSLDRLGHQVLSNEPGGYDLVAWTKSFNSLLDDFQERVGGDRVTSEFRARRQEASASLALPPPSQEIDGEMERLTADEVAAKEAIAESNKKVAERRASLKGEREICASELRVQREKVVEAKEARKSRPFFSRLRNSGPSVEQEEKKVEDLEAKLKGLDDELEKARKSRGDGDSRGAESAQRDAERTLDKVLARLDELRSAREERLQLRREREIATQTLAGIISSMKLDGGTPEDGKAVQG